VKVEINTFDGQRTAPLTDAELRDLIARQPPIWPPSREGVDWGGRTPAWRLTMTLTRREWLATSALLASPAWAKKSKLRIGVTDWNLRLAGKVEAVALAKQIGFEGVEISLGRRVAGDQLPLDDAALQQQYLGALKQHGIAAAGTCLDVLHVNYLKSDKLGQKWVLAGIPITRKLGARVMLMPFFGKGALETRPEREYVGDFLREAAREAEKAKVVLGLENTCSARDNAFIMERARSKAVGTYYDVGNSTRAGYDIFEELQWLGAQRICQLHLKDNPGFIGEGKIDFPKAMNIIMSLGFNGFANLETDSPTKSVENDMKRNLGYVRRLLNQPGQS
jgi:sugar phosphate isomerase/epimerase